jgi:hypothetical protein
MQEPLGSIPGKVTACWLVSSVVRVVMFDMEKVQTNWCDAMQWLQSAFF